MTKKSKQGGSKGRARAERQRVEPQWLSLPRRFWPQDLRDLDDLRGPKEVDLIVPSSTEVPMDFHENPLVLAEQVRVAGVPRRAPSKSEPPPPFGDEKLARFLRGVARITAKAWVDANNGVKKE